MSQELEYEYIDKEDGKKKVRSVACDVPSCFLSIYQSRADMYENIVDRLSKDFYSNLWGREDLANRLMNRVQRLERLLCLEELPNNRRWEDEMQNSSRISELEPKINKMDLRIKALEHNSDA